MYKCLKHPRCFYCRIFIDHDNKTIEKITCDYYDGEVIKNMPKEVIENCTGHKTERDMKKWFIDY